ncbi:MAG: AzlD domain-containing protein [Bacteroidaceae bacterium]|nr:AzlD domain-containing protein [Bacteroidaceae bacterium]
MSERSLFIYIAVTALATNLVRVLPVLLIRKRIENRFIRSFLHYVPYITLSVMTFPAIMEATSPAVGLTTLAIGVVCAWRGLGLLPVSLICCICVFLLQLL